jgi:hypothetical protein
MKCRANAWRIDEHHAPREQFGGQERFDAYDAQEVAWIAFFGHECTEPLAEQGDISLGLFEAASGKGHAEPRRRRVLQKCRNCRNGNYSRRQCIRAQQGVKQRALAAFKLPEHR